MRKLLAAALVGAPIYIEPATAAEPTITDACLKAAEHYFSAKTMWAHNVQAFPEASPPRVRLDAGVFPPGHAMYQQGLQAFSCTFASATKPFGLAEFCDAALCLKSGFERFDEAVTILEREGY